MSAASFYQQLTSAFTIWMHRDQKDKSVPAIAYLTYDSIQGNELQSKILKPTSRFKTLPSSGIDFQFDPKAQEAQSDAVNVFYHAQASFERVQSVLEKLGKSALLHPSKFPWGMNRPISFDPWGMQDANAYFDPSVGALVFGYFRSPTNGRWVDTCDSADIIVHEMGHAILHILRPLYNRSTLVETGAFHEQFGDMMAVFHALSHTRIREEWYRANQGNFLHTSTLVSRLATEFGDELYPGSQALRNADNQLRLGDTSNEIHDLSQVLTGAMFDCLMGILDVSLSKAKSLQSRPLSERERDEIVVKTINEFEQYYFSALLNSSQSNIRFSEFAQNFLAAVPIMYRAVVIDSFQFRRINVQPSLSLSNRTAEQKMLDKIDERFRNTLITHRDMDYKKAGACGYMHHSGGTAPLLASVEAKIAILESDPGADRKKIRELKNFSSDLTEALELDKQELSRAIVHGFTPKNGRAIADHCLLARGESQESRHRKKCSMGCAN